MFWYFLYAEHMNIATIFHADICVVLVYTNKPSHATRLASDIHVFLPV